MLEGDVKTMNRKYFIIGLSIVVVLWIAYVIVGRQIPIHRSSLTVGDERIYYRETSRMIQCDVAYFEIVVHNDGTDEYVYELISVGNGSCLSDLYVWDNFKMYRLNMAIELDIVSLEDFLESDFVIKRPISTE